MAVRVERVKGTALLDVILAVTVFALAVTGVAMLMQEIADTSNAYGRDTLIRYGLESILTEARHRDLNEMTLEQFDEAMGVTFATQVEALDLANIDGEALAGMYVLRAEARESDGSGEAIDSAELYVYKPE